MQVADSACNPAKRLVDKPFERAHNSINSHFASSWKVIDSHMQIITYFAGFFQVLLVVG
jgi:hypothetical protein